MFKQLKSNVKKGDKIALTQNHGNVTHVTIGRVDKIFDKVGIILLKLSTGGFQVISITQKMTHWPTTAMNGTAKILRGIFLKK